MVATMAETIRANFFCITAQFCLYHIVNKKNATTESKMPKINIPTFMIISTTSSCDMLCNERPSPAPGGRSSKLIINYALRT